MRRAAIVIVAVAAVVSCARPAPPPTPTPVASTPTPATTPVPTLDAASTDTQYAFLTNVNDLTSDIETLASAQCAELTAEFSDNPTEVAQIRGFAQTLQRLGTSQPLLSASPDVRSSLDDLTKALSQMDATLSTCGINSP